MMLKENSQGGIEDHSPEAMARAAKADLITFPKTVKGGTSCKNCMYFRNMMVDGKPAFVLSRKECPVLRKGFMSGYHFKRMQIAGSDARYQDKPNKNRFSHPHDALQYGVMPFAAERGRGMDIKWQYSEDGYWYECAERYQLLSGDWVPYPPFTFLGWVRTGRRAKHPEAERLENPNDCEVVFIGEQPLVKHKYREIMRPIRIEVLPALGCR